jgi:probable rRNA maturation factor
VSKPSLSSFEAMQPNVILKRAVPGLSEKTLAAFVVEASRAAGLRGAVTLLVTSSREMRKLNLRFRNKDKATDVLSFPSPAFIADFSGDIAVSLDMAGQNARALGHSVAAEVRILVLHGILHLAGYDHEVDRGDMARRERLARKRLGLPVGLIERTSQRSRRRKGVRSRI